MSKAVWNEKNELVDPELNKHYREQAEVVLGGRSAVDGAKITEPVEPTPIDINAPFVSQQSDSQTADPMTSPQPDFGNKPNALTPMTEEAKKIDDTILKEAAKLSKQQATDEPVGDPDPPAPPEPPKPSAPADLPDKKSD